ncbi:hypothetical protein B0J13DRAFT_325377 [Dactylonectria estremocensis]|uniref:Stc1 domain-containing protein n=1 Tax=Dactylonectria estremocensis TaxID=1079267 RepID=A0A9P9EUX1_9HYPO|nr:hypothetical protein B0J13DRAFT_325377 [Dactylonectria estremocensis]
MAPNKNKGVYQPETTFSTATRYRCKVGGEWKPLDAFSGNQQKLIQRGNPNPAHSGMTCRDHTSKCRTEARCEVCLLIKPKDQFSKSSLKGDEYVCKRCIAWTETQEPSVTPHPLETGHISAEEVHVDVWQQKNFGDNAEFFADDGLPKAPITDLGTLGLHDLDLYGEKDKMGSETLSRLLDSGNPRGKSIADTASVSGESTTTSKATLPPHLAIRSTPSVSAPKSIAGASTTTKDSSASSGLPPHLRNRATRDSYAGSVSTATTVRKDREERDASRRIPFNAWGPNGKQYQGIKDPTVSTLSSHASESSASIANPNKPKDGGSVPDSSPQPRRRGNWPKASESRIPQSELKKQPLLTHTDSRHLNPDIDRQRKKYYCDSEDSDY